MGTLRYKKNPMADSSLQTEIVELQAQVAKDHDALRKASLNGQKLMMLCLKMNQKLNLMMEMAKSAVEAPVGSSVGDVSAGDAPLMCGFMNKRAKNDRSWKKRWFVLRKGALSYYTDQNATTPKGTIPLATCIVDGLKTRENTTRPCMALIVEGRTLYCEAETKKDNVAWFLAINCMQQQLDYSRKLEAQGEVPDARILAFFDHPLRTVLDLSDSPLAVEAITSMESSIRFHSALTKLVVKAASLRDEHMEPLARALAGNKFLTVVNLSANDLSPAAATGLAAALDKNTSITELYLASNRLGDQGVSALADVLADRTPLSVLDLSDNEVSDAGFSYFVDNLAAAGSAIPALDFASNAITSAAITDSLIPALSSLSSLKKLGLASNDIDDAGAVAILSAAPSTSLSHIILSGNPYSPDEHSPAQLSCILGTPSLVLLDMVPVVIDEQAAASIRILRDTNALSLS